MATPLRPSATRTEPKVCPRSASSRSAFSMCGGRWFGADIEASLETLRFSEIDPRKNPTRIASGTLRYRSRSRRRAAKEESCGECSDHEH